MFKLDLEKAEEPEINWQHPLDHWKSKRVPEKHLVLLYWLCQNCVDHNKLWKILKQMGIPDHLTCLLRNLYAGQEATVRTGHTTADWFQIWKRVHQGCILLPWLFNVYAEYIMWHARLDEAQSGVKIAGRNISNLRYADAAAAAAKLLQSCLTLCNPIDGSPPGSPIPGILQARTVSGLPFPSPMHESEKWKWSRSVMSDS